MWRGSSFVLLVLLELALSGSCCGFAPLPLAPASPLGMHRKVFHNGGSTLHSRRVAQAPALKAAVEQPLFDVGEQLLRMLMPYVMPFAGILALYTFGIQPNFKNLLITELANVKKELKEDIGKVQQELKEDIGKVQQELKEDIGKVQQELNNNTKELAVIQTMLGSFDKRVKKLESRDEQMIQLLLSNAIERGQGATVGDKGSSHNTSTVDDEGDHVPEP